MFNDIKLGEKSSRKLNKQYDLSVKNVCLHTWKETGRKQIKVLMGPSLYGRIMDDFICMYVHVSFSVFSKVFLHNHFIRKKYFFKVTNNYTQVYAFKVNFKKNYALKVKCIIYFKPQRVSFLISLLSVTEQCISL